MTLGFKLENRGKTPHKAPIKSEFTGCFGSESFKATFPTHAGVQNPHLTHLCLSYGIPLCSTPRWSGVVEPSRAGLTLLALYFPRHFRSQQLRVRSHSTNVSHRRASPCVPCAIIPSFSIHSGVREMSPPGSKGDLHSLHTLGRSGKLPRLASA